MTATVGKAATLHISIICNDSAMLLLSRIISIPRPCSVKLWQSMQARGCSRELFKSV